MAGDPTYVKLAPRLVNGMVADVEGGSGWSIAGLDVRHFPKDNDVAARFVRAKLTAGVLEPAGKGEWEEVHNDDEVLELVNSFRPEDKDFVRTATSWQEAKVQRVVQAARAALEANRLEDVEEALNELDDARREALLEEQDDMNLGTDDAEEQVAKTVGARPRSKKAAAAKKAAAKKDEGE